MNRHLFRVVSPLLAAVLLFPLSTAAWSAQWVWQADNHADNTSLFTDSKTKLTVTENGAKWLWDSPAAGAVTVTNAGSEAAASDLGGWVRVITDEFGDEWDLRKGMTFAVRAKPLSDDGQFSLCIKVKNSSTAGLPGDAASINASWAVPGITKLYDKPGRSLRVTTMDVAKYLEGDWYTFTVGAVRMGDTVAWDVWVNGDHQGADKPAPDGSLHTLVYVVSVPSEADTHTRLELGAKHRFLMMRNVVIDYIAVTNDGVLRGWDGGDARVHAVSPAHTANPAAANLAATIRQIDALVEDKNYDEADVAIRETMGTLRPECDARARDLLIGYISVIAKDRCAEAVKLMSTKRYEEAVALLDKSLLKHDGLPVRYLDQLMFTKASACRSLGRIDEAIDGLKSVLPEITNPKEKASILSFIGRLYFGAKRYTEALDAFTEVTNSPGTDSESKSSATFFSGLCYQATGQHSLAVDAMNEILTNYPSTYCARKAKGALQVWETDGPDAVVQP